MGYRRLFDILGYRLPHPPDSAKRMTDRSTFQQLGRAVIELEAGALGALARRVVLAISNPGETAEILTLLPIIKRMGVKLVAFIGNHDSTLARQADAAISVAVEREACPHHLAPPASPTAALAMGDALAVTLLKSRGLT